MRAVYLMIGEGRDIVEDYFESLFQFLARGTVAEHAEIVLYRVPYMVRCKQCGQIFHVKIFDRSTWGCPSCQAYQEVSGMEFVISRIEVAAAKAGLDGIEQEERASA